MGQKFGQHFLKRGKILETIRDRVNEYSSNTIVEIGPGNGVLTEYLLETNKQIIAIEKDIHLAQELRETYTDAINAEKLIILEEDIRSWDPVHYIGKKASYAVVGNIPFYITGSILRNTLENEYQPEAALFVAQKEIADRVMRKDGKETLLSLSIEAYSTPYYLGKIKAGNFTPPPKVDAAILELTNINRENFKEIEENHFFSIIKSAFGQRRKKAVKNLKEAGFMHPEHVFEQLGIDTATRAEDISLYLWIEISRKII